jgi:hypothetical protein
MHLYMRTGDTFRDYSDISIAGYILISEVLKLMNRFKGDAVFECSHLRFI